MPRSLGLGQGKMSKNSYFTLFLFLCDCISHKPKQSSSSKGQVYLISRSYQHQQKRNQFSVYFKCLCDLCYADGKLLMERNSCYASLSFDRGRGGNHLQPNPIQIYFSKHKKSAEPWHYLSRFPSGAMRDSTQKRTKTVRKFSVICR